jgi:Holliday junction resolvasome RuvABC endonuclease subunit
MSTTTHPTVLGIDPGTSEMGLAVIRGRELLAYGVRKLRNGTKPYDLIGQARRILFAAIRSHAPDIVAIEKALLLPTKRASLMAVIVDELRQRAAELNLTVAELSPLEVRQAVVGNSRATKIDVAVTLVNAGFEQLRPLIPERPARAALGLRPKDKYWLHMFDALAVAVAVAQHGAVREREPLRVG